MSLFQFTEYAINGKTYIDLKEVRANCKLYCKGTRSMAQLIERKNLQDAVYGLIKDGAVIVTETLSRQRGTTFVVKEELAELFIDSMPQLPPAPPVIEDKDLVFFRDEDGKEYDVLMRGERTRKGIYFNAKDVERVFQMKRIDDIIQKADTRYCPDEHYVWFASTDESSLKELYLTYNGLRRVITNSRVLNRSHTVGYVYLIKLDPDGHIYKFGKSWSMDVRLKTHRLHFAKWGYNSIELIYTAEINVANMAAAEASIKEYLVNNGLYRSFEYSNEIAEISDDDIPKLIDHYRFLSQTMLSGSDKLSTLKRGLAFMKDQEDDLLFNAAFGTVEEKAKAFARSLDVDAGHLKAIMSKCPTAITCLYLIDILISDNEKRVFKYGFTKNLQRRFNEHIKTYGESIKLDTFIFIPELDLSKAEATFRKSISKYHYAGMDGKDELISLCDEAYANVQTIFSTIMSKHCGNFREQNAYYQSKYKEFEADIIINEERCKRIIAEKDCEVYRLQIQLLELKLQMQS